MQHRQHLSYRTHKLLIANRGEIACRIMATAKQLGIPTVALFSAADTDALHVSLADEAVYIGPAPSEKSYLVIDNIIQAAHKTGATLIHPGYGFLAENAQFAQRCRDNGLIFIGPSPQAIELMSDKAKAKAEADALKIPTLKGYDPDHFTPTTQSEDRSTFEQRLFNEALNIGAPLLLKATAGGGGRGMRLIESLIESDRAQFLQQLSAAQREALSSFGDDRIMLEKYVPQPRHIEIQIFADPFGHCVHLLDRDCSIQRRHQKVVEEAPAQLEPTLREKLYEDAIDLAKAIGYVGAGTVEFLVDSENNYYFLEMNTRLQVEHPVTEEITNLDLVELQIRTALGEPLPFEQSDISGQGHAIEVRLNAENPDNDFSPSTGTIEHLNFPDTLRIETGIQPGSAISIHYDPTLAKLIAWGETRQEAIQRLQHGLRYTELTGVTSNLYFLQRVIGHPDFRHPKPAITTAFLPEHHFFQANKPYHALKEQQCDDALLDGFEPEPDTYQILAAAALFEIEKQAHNGIPLHYQNDPHSLWLSQTGWQINAPSQQRRHYLYQDEYHALHVTAEIAGYQVEYNNNSYHFRCALNGNRITLEQHGHQVHWRVIEEPTGFSILTGQAHYSVSHIDAMQQSEQESSHGEHVAPMPAAITRIIAAPDQPLNAGDPILVLEAMKMEHTLCAPSDGTVTELYFSEGDSVSEGDILFHYEASGADPR